MKKKNQNEKEPDNKEKAAENTAGADSASTEEDAGEKAESTVNTGEEGAQNNGGAKNKEPDEKDILKLYLQQCLAQLKKAKDENDELNKSIEAEKSNCLKFKQSLEALTGEYDNYRRRTSEEKENIYSDAVSKAVSSLLPALDSLDAALKYADSNPESFKHGVEMTKKQLESGFKTLGVEEIEAEGKEFDPEMHNAVMHTDDDSLGENLITEVFQKGYKIGDKIIRHSMVKVAN